MSIESNDDNHLSLSRRTVAKGLAWSVPAIAASQVVPAFAASEVDPLVEACGVSPEEVFSGTATSAQIAKMFIWPVEGGTYSLTFGAIAPGKINLAGGWDDSEACGAALAGRANIITTKIRNYTGENYLPAPRLTDADGELVSEGAATLGNVASGGYFTGFRYSATLEFADVKNPNGWGTLAYPLTLTVPFEVSYTATEGELNGQVIRRIVNLTFTIPDSSSGVKAMREDLGNAPVLSGGGRVLPDNTVVDD